MCGETGKTISHIVSECSKLGQTEYKRRHDNIVRMVHWKLRKKFNLEKSEQRYLHNPQTVSENINRKLRWDKNIQYDSIIVEGKPNFVIVNKMEKTKMIMDVAKSGDKRKVHKEKEKIEKYQNRKRDIPRLWNLKNIDVIPVVFGGYWKCYKEF